MSFPRGEDSLALYLTTTPSRRFDPMYPFTALEETSPKREPESCAVRM
jgi:hypothetical protein